MPEMHLYEYAVIRVLPAVEREEFINVGLILFCKKAKFIKVLFELNEKRLRAFSGELDMKQVCSNLEAFEKIAIGDKSGGPIASFDLAERFRWLTAVKSSSIQTSRPHPGLCSDLESTSQRLFRELVL